MTRLLSLIITSKDNERFIDICELLASVKMQDYPMEAIFVSENPALTKQIIHYAVDPPMYNIVILNNNGEPGLSGGRNHGVKAASGDIIAFVDDDCLLYPDWAKRMVEPYQDSMVIGVTGHAFPLWDDEDMAWFPKELQWLISCTGWTGRPYKPRVVNSGWGTNMSFRREAFEKCGGFNLDTGYHKGLVAEDIEFSHRVRRETGKVIMFDPTVKVLHKVHEYRLSPEYIKARSIWIGRSHRTARNLYPEDKRDDTGLLTATLRRLPTMTPQQVRLTMRALWWVGWGYANVCP